MKRITALLHVVDSINTWVGRAVAILILPILGVTLYGVIMRYLVHRPTVWGGEVLLLIFVPVAVMAGGYVLAQDEHIRIDVLYSRWSPRGKAIANVATFAVFLLVFTILGWVTIEMAWRSVKVMEVAPSIFRGPVYPKKIALALGAILFLLGGMAQFIRNIRFIRGRGKIGEANSER
jgi:TRAP-type mannitol/chloroaromatic compound transport system permease small subunit